MKPAFKAVVSWILMVCMLAMPCQALAGLSDALDGMFMSNATAVGSVNSQTRGGLIGGGVAVRMPIRSINLVSFDPPRLSAGCGGIDMFGGSFSFINADALVALFRQIAANAVGVAFKAAINAINPSLAKLMEDFQAKLQQLNQMMKNTCAIATSMVTAVTGDQKKQVGENGSATTNSMSGTISGWFDQLDNDLTDPNAFWNKAISSGEAPQFGNPVWGALVSSNAGSLLGSPIAGETDSQRANETIMTLTGYSVIAPDSKSTKEDGAGHAQVSIGANSLPLMTLQDLRNGNVDGKNMALLHCTDSDVTAKGCLNVSALNITFPGVKGKVNMMLFGSTDGLTTTSNSIVGLISSCTSTNCNPSAEQSAFLAAVPIPIWAILQKSRTADSTSDAAAVHNIAIQLSPLATDALTIRYGQAALTAVTATFVNSKYDMPAVVRDSVLALRKEVLELSKEESKEIEALNNVNAFVSTIISANPALLVAGRKN